MDLSVEVINLDDERLLRSYDAVGRMIFDYIIDMELYNEVQAAKNIYFGNSISNTAKIRTNYKSFVQWLIFSYKLSNGGSLIDCVYKKSYNLKEYEKNALHNLKNTAEGLYKVYSKHENLLISKDIFTGKLVYIYSKQLTACAKRYTGVYARTAPLNEKSIPIPGYIVLSNSLLKEFEAYIIEKYINFSNIDHSLTIQEFMSKNSLMLHRFLLKNGIM